ncbi:NAD(P)-binding domain-containing protein [Kitasatospora sp. NPDC096077]|uniref:flavin-containing monooxygenase n=1 Tax=Kitasatospora sp. NPDC096077 TaxID=3155544 RepID=UPI0033183D4A
MNAAGATDRVCVIGAGASGIAACRSLALRGIPFDCFERGPQVGGLWRYPPPQGRGPGYPSLFANTSKSVMQYPSHPMPEDFPDYPHHAQVARYFDDYTDRYDLRRHIRFDTGVRRVEPVGDSWAVTLDDGTAHRYQAVLVASGGRHGEPVHARFDGEYTGRQLHSVDYAGPEEFAGRTVVVVGLGATAADIATEVSRVAGTTLLAVRTGHYVVPKILEGRPIDRLSPLMRRLTPEQRSPLVSLVIKLVHGDMTDWGLPAPPYKPGRGPLIANSEFLPAIAHGRITPKPVIVSAEGGKVRFGDGEVVDADAIIHCTGYRLAFPFLDGSLVRGGDDAPPLYHQAVPPELPGLYFVGLLHSMTALMPLAEAQSEWIGDLLTGTVRLPPRGEMWSRIRAARRRQDRRFHDSSGHLLVDPHEYERLLADERRTHSTRRTHP